MADANEYQTFTGVIEGRGDTRASTDAEGKVVARRILEHSRSTSTRVLSPDAFGELLETLREAGLYKLPEHRGTSLPKDEPYFVVETKGVRRVFLRPSVRRVAPDDPGIPLVATWRQVKAQFFTFLLR